MYHIDRWISLHVCQHSKVSSFILFPDIPCSNTVVERRVSAALRRVVPAAPEPSMSSRSVYERNEEIFQRFNELNLYFHALNSLNELNTPLELDSIVLSNFND